MAGGGANDMAEGGGRRYSGMLMEINVLGMWLWLASGYFYIPAKKPT